MKQRLLRALGWTGPPTVVVFLSGDPDLARSMAAQMRDLLPNHPQVVIGRAPLDAGAYAYASEVIEVSGRSFLSCWLEVRRRLRGRRIALAPFLWTSGGTLRWMPWLLAPHKLLAFNSELERHHLRLSYPIASWRFLRGWPVGDIYRPTIFAPLRTAAGFLSQLVRWRAALGRQPAVPATLPTPRSTPELEAALREPGVWLACSGEKLCLDGDAVAPGEVKDGEILAWSLCPEQPEALAYRREICDTLPACRSWTQLSLEAWLRGHRTVCVFPKPPQSPGARVRLSPSRRLPLLQPGLHFFQGRPSRHRRRAAVVSPYLPFPLAHGGAIRIYNLLRAAARDTDLYLLAFAERETGREVIPLLDFCSRVVLVQTPRWDPPSLCLPKGVSKFRSPAMEGALAALVSDYRISLVQVEYTQLAHFGRALRRLPVRSILVEHDVTFDLHRQIRLGSHGGDRISARMEEARWRSYELRHARRFDRIIAMSEEDRNRLAAAGMPDECLAVVENGVDLDRFQPSPPASGPGAELLFIGSFRHFPNILGFRFLLERVWPKVAPAAPDLRLTVVAGADHRYYFRRHTGADLPPLPPNVLILDYVEDVRPLYQRATLVLVPLPVSAGTNIKVLEALAMARPVVSTPVGVAGLGLIPGEHAMIADRPDSFAAAILSLLWNPEARDSLAAAGRSFVESRYGWETLAQKLVAEWDRLLHSQ